MFKQFNLLLGLRLLLLLTLVAATAYLIVADGYPTAALLCLAAVVLSALELARFVSRTNHELARFLDAVRYADFGQRFAFSDSGAGFQELGETFNHILDRFREDRGEQERALKHLKALLEHVPVPLMSLYADGRISLWNNAARRLFDPHTVGHLEDLSRFGCELMPAVERIRPGGRILVQMAVENHNQSLTLSASEIVTSGATERLISLHNIQTELDGMQLDAWQALVRVLTHEIMNSITPLSSLAHTATDLIREAEQDLVAASNPGEHLRDAQSAVETLARRADGLTDFVSSYRQLLSLPEPVLGRFRVSDLLEDVERMTKPEQADQQIELTFSTDPEALELNADRTLLEQVLLNLINNSAQAGSGRISLRAGMNNRSQIFIEVTDDGPGIPEDVAERMFVPFYTTRRDGTGVGLALSQQIMNAHDGSIGFGRPAGGGARFTLVFGT